jgi:holo-[acyl-carrier protein] synthase
MIIGTGVDIVEIDRLKNKETDNLFLSKIFTENEISYFLKKTNPTPSLAAHFASKEAFLKALGTGMGYGFSTIDCEIFHDEYGKPYYKLSSRVYDYIKTKFNCEKVNVHLSISHDKNYALAFAIIECC